MDRLDSTLGSLAADSQVAIKVENLSKIYKLYNSPIDRLKEALSPIRQQYHHDFHALNDVNFEVKKGEMVGIVGKNGSGKSTLLKLVTGVLTPSTGKVMVNGRISALLELGAGFNYDLTGIENVYFVGTLMGYSKDEMDAKLDEILGFADIGEFVYQPIKTYSSGMFVRLAFAVNINVDPEILIIDEALSVGDAYFVQKCMRRIQKFIELGKTILFVSHDQQTIKNYCKRALLLQDGKLHADSSPKQIIDLYNAFTFDSVTDNCFDRTKNKLDESQRYGSKQAEITRVALYNSDGKQTLAVMSLENTTIAIEIYFKESLSDVLFGFSIRSSNGIDVYMNNTAWQNIEIVSVQQDDQYKVSFAQQMGLAPGKYSVTAVVSQITSAGIKRIDWIGESIIFDVISENKFSGICNLNTKIHVECSSSSN